MTCLKLGSIVMPEPFQLETDWIMGTPLHGLNLHWSLQSPNGYVYDIMGEFTGGGLKSMFGRGTFTTNGDYRVGTRWGLHILQSDLLASSKMNLDWDGKSVTCKAVTVGKYEPEHYENLWLKATPVTDLITHNWLCDTYQWDSRHVPFLHKVLELPLAQIALSVVHLHDQPSKGLAWSPNAMTWNQFAVAVEQLTENQQDTLVALSVDWYGSMKELLTAAKSL